MRQFLFLLMPFFLAACASHEGVVSYCERDGYSMDGIQLRGAAYSTPIKTPDNTIVLGTHKKSIYFLTTNDTIQTEHRKNLPMHSKSTIVNSYRAKLWIHATPEIVFDSLVAIGSYDGNMYFFRFNGELYKKIKMGGRIYTNPVQLGDDCIAFGLGFKGLKLYNILNDSLLIVNLKRLTHGSPTVMNENLVCIGGNDKTMHFIDKQGNELSQFKAEGWIMHSKALLLSDSVVVFGSYDNNLYSVSSSGNLEWKYTTNGKIHASPQQFANGNIICGSFDKNIYVLSPQGNLISKIPTGKRVVSSAAIIGDYAIVGSYDKNLYVINSKGEVVKRMFVGGKIFSSPIILDDDTFFCATTKGKAFFVNYKIAE